MQRIEFRQSLPSVQAGAAGRPRFAGVGRAEGSDRYPSYFSLSLSWSLESQYRFLPFDGGRLSVAGLTVGARSCSSSIIFWHPSLQELQGCGRSCGRAAELELRRAAAGSAAGAGAGAGAGAAAGQGRLRSCSCHHIFLDNGVDLLHLSPCSSF